MICKTYSAGGFTLAEIIVSVLLLSLFSIGTFRSAHFAQHSANHTLYRFTQTTQEKQSFTLNKLKQKYSTIHIDPEFGYLDCLVNQNAQHSAAQQLACVEFNR